MSDRRLIDGEMVTIEELMEKHQGMIWYFSGKYKREYLRTVMDWDDLRSIVYEALIIAFHRYKPEREVNFTTLLQVWVKNRMNKEMIRMGTLYIPEKAHQCIEDIRANDDFHLTAAEIAEKYETPKPTAEAIEQYFRFSFRSIQNNLNGDDGEMKFEEIIGVHEDVTMLVVRDFLETLTQEQRLIISWRAKELSYKEIGEMLGMTKQAVGLKMKKIKEAWGAFEEDQLISS